MPKSLPVEYESADWTLSLSPLSLSLCSSHLLKHTHASLLPLYTKHLFYIIPVISCVLILFQKQISVWLQEAAAKWHDTLRYWFCFGWFYREQVHNRKSDAFIPSIGLNKHLFVGSVNRHLDHLVFIGTNLTNFSLPLLIHTHTQTHSHLKTCSLSISHCYSSMMLLSRH